MTRSKTEKIILWVFFAIFLLYSITLIFPFIWLSINSLKTHQEFFNNVWSFPKSFKIINYKTAIMAKVGETSFLEMVWNSIFLSSILTFIGVIFPTMASYVVCKYNFKLKKFCYLLSIIVISVPTIGGTAAVYKLFKVLNIYNTYFSILLMGSGGFGFSFLLMHGAFKSLSWDYAEAAFIDGATDIRVFFKIMIPMVWPVVITLVVLGFLGSWNDYFTVYMFAPSKPTLAVGIKQFSDNLSSAEANYPVLFALMMISLIPSVLIYAFFQKPIMNSMNGGGLKG